MNGTLPEPVRDVALLVARVVLGVVLFAHGWQKVVIYGIAETRNQFEALGIPAAIASSSFVAFVEFVGGFLLVLGALVPLVVALHLVVMIGAAAFVHVSNGIFAADGGWELVGVIAACELVLGACGAGRFSVDRLILARMRREPTIRPLAERPAAARAPQVADEPATSAIPVVRRSGPDAEVSVFGEPTPASAPPEQTGARHRRLPRPITPLQKRADVPRRPDPRPLDRTDDPAEP
jgi:putative oxidoreductase